MPLTFANPADYDKIQIDDKISILGLTTFAPGKVNIVCDLIVAVFCVINIFDKAVLLVVFQSCHMLFNKLVGLYNELYLVLFVDIFFSP